MLCIDQSVYACNVVRRFQQSNLPGILTLMATDAQSTLAENRNKFEGQIYLQTIGSLMHLLHTCPELAFAVGKVSQFSSKPQTNHWTTIIQIL